MRGFRSELWVLVVLSALGAACGDDASSGDDTPASEGKAGKGGKGGAGGAGGSGQGGGGAGSGGASGGGQGGSSAGFPGAGGSAGSQAGAGAGGGPGGSAGSAGASSGSAGASGAGASGEGGAGSGGSAGQSGSGGSAGSAQAGQGGSGQAGSAGSAGSAGGPSCKPPDMLIVLDRTQTMHKTPAGEEPVDAPDYKSSKWYQAVTAIEQMVTPPADATLRFGLELWPRDPGTCVTLAQKIGGTDATNPFCEAGEVVIDPALSTGTQIKNLLDPATTKLCISTPTGKALLTAKDKLKATTEPGRDQYVVLVTDGADWDQSCPDPNPLPIVQQLKAEGIKTFIVGFSAESSTLGGVGLEFLNNMACAGGTAKGYPGSCKDDGSGNMVAVDPKSSPLFLQAGSGTQLTAALQSVAGSLCCGCQVQCDAPDVLFTLDRTQTMHKTKDGMEPVDAPDYKSSKWYQAITGIEQVVTTLDSQFRFGLELWPRDPNDNTCLTLAQKITTGANATNPPCEGGEVVVEPALSKGGAIASLLDPATTRLCNTTPTGEALITASTWLTTHVTPGRAQYVVMVTDGADWAQSCATPDPILEVQKLAASGIKTFTVGFFSQSSSAGGVGVEFLNDMACAGQTAKGFPANCKQTDTGYVAADPKGPTLYLGAEDSSQLEGVLSSALGDLGCKL